MRRIASRQSVSSSSVSVSFSRSAAAWSGQRARSRSNVSSARAIFHRAITLVNALSSTSSWYSSGPITWRMCRQPSASAIGPDEYHEDVDDNAFTNVMARWNIARALETLDLLRERWPNHAAGLREKLALGDDEIADWRDAIARIVVGLDPATGVYEQFAGFHALEPLDLAAYAERTVPIDVVIGR